MAGQPSDIGEQRALIDSADVQHFLYRKALIAHVRVITVIERVYRSGILPAFMMFGERKGTITGIWSESLKSGNIMLMRAKRLSEIAAMDVDGDRWSASVCDIDQKPNPIINDEEGKVALYLRHIQILWQLGLKRAFEPGQVQPATEP
jgi:hypothetical protein